MSAHKIKQITELRKKTNQLIEELQDYNDGHIYRLTTWIFRSSSEHECTNSFIAKEYMDEYYGDNGIVLLETSNKEFAKEVADHECLNGNSVTILELNKKENE